MTDLREPQFGLRPPIQVNPKPDDDPEVRAWVQRIATLSTPVRELENGEFKSWIRSDDKRGVG